MPHWRPPPRARKRTESTVGSRLGARLRVALTHRLCSRSRLRKALAPEPGERILELSPNKGYYSSSTAECLQPNGVLEILAPDPAILEQAIRSARACGIANIVARPGDARALPYPDEIFDAVYLVFGFGGMHDPRGVLVEVARVLKPAGRVVIGGLPRSLPWLRCRMLEVLAVGVGLVLESRSSVPLVCLARFRRPSVVEI